MTVADLITNALYEMNAIAPGEPLDADSGKWSLSKLNDMLDQWSARSAFVYSTGFNLYTLTVGKAAHLIGPGANITNTSLTSNVATYTAANNFASGDLITTVRCTHSGTTFNVANQQVIAATQTQFTTAITHADVTTGADVGIAYPAANAAPDFAVVQRPVRIEGASLVLNNVTPVVDLPITHDRDDDWWNYQRVKSLPSNIPTDLFYSADYPNGQLNFWPIPNFAYGVRLMTWSIISQFANLTDTVSLPPGYRDAITMSLAERLCSSFEKVPSPLLVEHAKLARRAIQGNNDASPRASTADTGQVPRGGGVRADYNWLTGEVIR